MKYATRQYKDGRWGVVGENGRAVTSFATEEEAKKKASGLTVTRKNEVIVQLAELVDELSPVDKAILAVLFVRYHPKDTCNDDRLQAEGVLGIEDRDSNDLRVFAEQVESAVR